MASALAALLAVALTACAGTGGRIAGSSSNLGQPRVGLDRSEVAAQLEVVSADLAAGAAWSAATRAASLRKVTALTPEEVDETEFLLERALETASASTTDSDVFDDFDSLGLSRRARAVLSIGHARALLDEDQLLDSFLEIRRLEALFPRHHLRAQAADLLLEAGIALAASTRRKRFLFPESGDTPLVLEYLVLNHPSHPGCATAYAVLGDHYADNNQLESAVARMEDLLLYHPQSPDVPRAEATIPHFRLALHLRNDFDRRTLTHALRELDSWLARYGDEASGGNEAARGLLATVQDDKLDCLERLTRNDLIVARFYRRVDEPFGAQLHALRALGLARDAHQPALVEEAQGLFDWAAAQLDAESPVSGEAQVAPAAEDAGQ